MEVLYRQRGECVISLSFSVVCSHIRPSLAQTEEEEEEEEVDGGEMHFLPHSALRQTLYV